MKSSRVAWLAAGLLLTVIAWLGWPHGDRRGDARERRRAFGHAAPQRPRPLVNRAAPPALRAAEETRAPGSALAARDDGGPGPHFEHYRGKSGRLPPSLQPVPAEPISVTQSLERAPSLELWVPRMRVGREGTAIFARLDTPDAEVTAAEVLIETMDQAAGNRAEAPVPMARDATAPRGDPLRFRHDFVPAPPTNPSGDERDTPPPRQHRFVVVVRGRHAGEPFVREAGGQFFVHEPGAVLLAETARIAPDAGDLALTVTAEIARAGTYFAFAELWGDGGKTAVAFARDRMPGLAAGRQTITLRFGGRILRDAASDRPDRGRTQEDDRERTVGPYVVRNLRFMQVDTHPAQEGAPIPELPPTPVFPAQRFE
ncbi:MAG TPA: hypothetical protein VGF45_12435 [Polyangia bacterium]